MRWKLWNLVFFAGMPGVLALATVLQSGLVGGQAYRFKAEALQPGTEYPLTGHVLEVAELTLMGVPQF